MIKYVCIYSHILYFIVYKSNICYTLYGTIKNFEFEFEFEFKLCLRLYLFFVMLIIIIVKAWYIILTRRSLCQFPKYSDRVTCQNIRCKAWHGDK